jgi:rhodanese-related sulfurtransferase
MRNPDILALFDYNYWATWTVLEAAKALPAEAFTAPSTITWRNLRGTLVRTLDVEQSWRRRLLAEPKEIWDAELPAEKFSTPAELETYWRSDAKEMRTWLAGLDDAAMAAIGALPKATPLAVHCHHGNRSRAAAEHFRQQGFTNLYNVRGGIDAWSQQIDPAVPRY